MAVLTHKEIERLCEKLYLSCRPRDPEGKSGLFVLKKKPSAVLTKKEREYLKKRFGY
jgi:hypothetical protein